jgi:hypothetical protein
VTLRVASGSRWKTKEGGGVAIRVRTVGHHWQQQQQQQQGIHTICRSSICVLLDCIPDTRPHRVGPQQLLFAVLVIVGRGHRVDTQPHRNSTKSGLLFAVGFAGTATLWPPAAVPLTHMACGLLAL